MNPATGEAMSGRMTFSLTPPHITTRRPPCTMAAPISPPISACEELLGMPNRQVTRFQVIAPITAARITTRISSRPTLGIFEDYALNDVGHVLALIDRHLQPLVDLLPLQDEDRVHPGSVEQAAQGAAVDGVTLVLEFVDLAEGAEE